MKEKMITIGSVEMPLTDYAISGTAILGIRDSGKTVTGKGIAEQMLEAGIPWIVFDAVGKWRWLKTPGPGRNGKGYEIVVVGGRKPDLPLNPHSISEIIRASIRNNIPLVIDLYDPKLSKADWRRIVQQSIRIIHYENEGVRHVFLEEAAEYIPQKVQDPTTYGEVEKFVRMGGNASVGITLINQRSQEVNKAVLDLCVNLVLGCQVGSRAIEAVEKWVDRLSPEIAKEVTESLPRLKSGEAWVWTRNNPDKPSREKIAMCRSLHPDRRTPDSVLTSVKSVSPEAFVKTLSDTLPKLVEEQKANDPADLKRQLAEAKREIDRLQKHAPAPEKKEVPALTEAERKRLTTLIESYERLEGVCSRIETMATEIKTASSVNRAEVTFFKTLLSSKLQPAPAVAPRVVQPIAPRATIRHSAKHVENGEFSIGKCERSILTALAQYPQGRSAVQIALLAQYSVNSGGFNNSLGKLRSGGFITRGQPVQITPEGMALLGDFTPLPTGEDLAKHWINSLGRCEAMILEALVKVYPNYLTADEVAEQTGYSRNSGGFNNSLGKLRTLELITRGQPIKASDDFFQ